MSGPAPEFDEQRAQIEELVEWWLAQADAEIQATAAKAVAYGSESMVQLGRLIANIAGREVSREEAVELASFFYIQGKIGRWLDAILRGERPSTDTVFDIRVYAGMVLRSRAYGDWPGKPKVYPTNVDPWAGGIETWIEHPAIWDEDRGGVQQEPLPGFNADGDEILLQDDEDDGPCGLCIETIGYDPETPCPDRNKSASDQNGN